MKVSFTPGPSQLYVTTESHVKTAFKTGIPSISHRSKEFEAIYKEAVSGLTELLHIPSGFHIVFTGSATEIWERSLQSLVADQSLHLVNGAFSTKYFEIAQQLGKHPLKVEVKDGSGFNDVTMPSADPELVGLTHNETSTGVSLPIEFINSFRDKYPKSIIAVDAVSSLPYPKFDFSKIDMLFFSVQKGFGLPAGLGVWIVNDKCVGKADDLLSKGMSVGSYHSLPSLISMSSKNQTPETPNVLGIFLLAQVTTDFVRRGITAIRHETNYKAALLYQALEKVSFAKPFVADPSFRSQTVIVADTGPHTERINKALQPFGLYPGDGYGKAKASQLRFANFPAHSKEQYELLADSLLKM
ncbi:MAG TPA: aminotransferase class V-fold PLP-dependent enzyme [Cyclobacteriaceae bacterium]|nr:aminotransferase class V-fold PLP-dependent enzyme [Cyclobacteriaceae bacterium]